MSHPQVVPSTEEHAREMAPRLREADKAEIAAMTGQYPESALMDGLEGDICMTGFSPEGDPLLMYGVAPSRFPGAGRVWMLATAQLEKHSIMFLRLCRGFVEPLHDLYPVLHNYVDARNELHIKWLKWLGCTFINTRTMGVQRRPFHEFVRIRQCAQ